MHKQLYLSALLYIIFLIGEYMATPEIVMHNQELLGEGLPLILDVEGGDHMPGFRISAKDLVLGAQVAKEIGINVMVVGLEDTVTESGLPYVVAQSAVVMGTDNKMGDMRDPRHSVNVAAKLVKECRASGFASACDTGAMVGASVLGLGRYGSIKTPLMAELPRSLKLGGHTYLLDAGAFPEDFDAIDLARYGVMGAMYAKALGNKYPKVAFLSNGSESTKGTQAVRNARAILADFDGQFELVEGFVEGRDLFGDAADVVITDGYTGNLVLKTAEGAVAAVLGSLPTKMRQNERDEAFVDMAKTDIYSLSGMFDANNVGGAPILGVKGNAIVMHGNSNMSGALNAITLLDSLAKVDFQSRLADALTRYKEHIKTT